MLKKLLNLLLPHQCTLCHASSDQDLDLCMACQQELPYIKNPCLRCALPLPINKKINLCAKCIKEPPYFNRSIALCEYQAPFSKIITRLKFQHQLACGKLLGELMANFLSQQWWQEMKNKPQLIIPVPLHKKRLQQRGFNQALEIAKPIANKLKIPIDIKCCQRIRNTQAQSEIHAKQRRKNVRKAFLVKDKVPEHIAIVDDVVTTGHTVNELSRCLRASGAKFIQVWCCARTNLL